MNINTVLSFLEEYGIFVIAVLVYIEYLNIPGFPGGLSAPAAGIYCGMYGGFFVVLLMTVTASFLSVMTVYWFGYMFAEKMKKLFLKSEKMNKLYEKTVGLIDKYGFWGLLVARFIPILRTFVSIPAGLMKMRLRDYIPVSIIGNFIYVLINMLLGFFFSNLFI